MKPIKIIIVTILCLISITWSFNLRDPHLLSLRNNETTILLFLFITIIIFSIFTKSNIYRFGIWITAAILMLMVNVIDLNFKYNKDRILNNPSALHQLINRRLIIGFNDVNEVNKLSLNGIAGIYITRRNIMGKSLNEIRLIIAKLQLRRKHAGLPPLMITTDQEGGPVSRLSPLIEQQPPLNSLVGRSNSSEMAFEYGNKQGKLLNLIGINTNFGPVVDLKPGKSPEALDFHTQINNRAISESPHEIIQVALPYIKGLEKNGVTATLKHFPGLGKVSTDTHHFAADLDRSVSELINDDWLPYIQLTSKTNAWIMLSHVTLTQVDEQNPVSTSNIVVNKIIRNKLGYKGILITDDLTMGATYNRGFCKSVLGSFEADINYLLIAYDNEKYYDAITCLEKHYGS